MPRKPVKRITEDEAKSLLAAYPGWVGRTGLLFNQDARRLLGASNWKKKFKETNPEAYRKAEQEAAYRRKLREAGLVPHRRAGRPSIKSSVLQSLLA